MMFKLKKLLSTTLVLSALITISGNADTTDARASTLINGKLQTRNLDKNLLSTLKTLTKEKGQWFTYRVEMEPNNGMPCCFAGKYFGNHNLSMGCSLQGNSSYSGSTHLKDANSEVVDIYINFNNRQPVEFFYVGSECPVDAKQQIVYQLNDISQLQSIAFLSSYIEATESGVSKRVSDKMMAAIAVHQGKDAQDLLEKYSASTNRNLRHEAIFWLGEARNKAGYNSIVKILDDKSIDTKTLSHAVFALSQLPHELATPGLVKVMHTAYNKSSKKEALFWLAQSEDPKALAAIEELLMAAVD